jgi:SAM-dependent methyltransferase
MQKYASYGDFAYIYDTLTDDVEYEKRAEYIINLINTHLGRKPELLCDLGCGTGTILTILNAKGYDCIGIDSSDTMLSVASEKNTDGQVLYLNQDICSFELYGTVDVFLSMLDTVNYITDKDDLDNMFKLIANYLNPDGIFIFDINSKYKFEHVLGNNTYVYEKDNVFYTWENYYEDGFLDFDINFFVKDDVNNYQRITEQHSQRFYDLDFLKELADKHGLKTVAVYGDLRNNAPTDEEERIFVVMRKQALDGKEIL